MSEKQSAARRPRADAARNRQKILDVAVTTLESDGMNFSMDAIAKAAGVGVGTLYRNFSTREDLIAAVLAEQGLKQPQVVEKALENGADSLAVLEEWLRALGDWFATYEGLTDPLRRAVDGYNSPLSMQCHDVIAQLDTLIEPARREGYVKDGVNGRDLYIATLGIAWATQHSDHPAVLFELLAQGWRA